MSRRLPLAGLFLGLLAGVILLQRAYDGQKLKNPPARFSESLQYVKSFDLGLHSAAASYLWISTRTQLPFLYDGSEKFMRDLALVNDLDPKFSTPYAFSVLVLPITRNFPERINAAVEIGLKGIAQADPNWRIPFYLATIYHLYIKDETKAATYFDLAARTQGIPEVVRRFAINYGILPSLREKSKQVWTAIYETATSDEAKERAKAYIVHYEILDFLDAAVANYKERYGRWPAQIDDLVAGGILEAIPPDPFGLEFFLYENGQVGIKKLPQEAE